MYINMYMVEAPKLGASTRNRPTPSSIFFGGERTGDFFGLSIMQPLCGWWLEGILLCYNNVIVPR